MRFVETGLVARAVGAASSIARDLGLRVEDVVVVQNSNKLALRLMPCDVLARVAVVGEEVAALEVTLAQKLGAASAPIASLDARVEPRVHVRDGFAITFWTYYESVTGTHVPGDYADALRRLHAAMLSVEVEAPHLTKRIAAAEDLVTDREQTPALGDADRVLLLDTLHTGRQVLCDTAHGDQLLHGEPHPGNLLSTRSGALFIDFETCCLGPIEFDVAHLPDDVSLRYPDVDLSLLQESRRLVLAMVAAWRWDVRDEFPGGRRQGLDIVNRLRNGPPWPTVGALAVR